MIVIALGTSGVESGGIYKSYSNYFFNLKGVPYSPIFVFIS